MEFKVKRSTKQSLSSSYKPKWSYWAEYEFKDKSGVRYFIGAKNYKKALSEARRISGMKDITFIKEYNW